jgi:hypothetical protein
MWHIENEEHVRILRGEKLGKTHIIGAAWLLQDDTKL